LLSIVLIQLLAAKPNKPIIIISIGNYISTLSHFQDWHIWWKISFMFNVPHFHHDIWYETARTMVLSGKKFFLYI